MNSSHTHDTTENLRLAFFLNLTFTLVEVVGGLLTNSIAILSDALHDLGDAASLGVAWYLENYADKAPDETFSFGYRRFSLLGALINTVVLIAGSLWILSNAVTRLMNPEPVQAGGMLLFAGFGVAVNGFAAYRLRSDESLNAKVAGWHMLEDVLGWTAVLVVSILLLFTDWYMLDPILSILITLYVLANIVRKLREVSRILLQATPESISIPKIRRMILTQDAVRDAHHIHLWSLDGEYHVLTAHVVVPPDTGKETASRLKQTIAGQIMPDNFAHSTIEIEYGADDCRLAEGETAVAD